MLIIPPPRPSHLLLLPICQKVWPHNDAILHQATRRQTFHHYGASNRHTARNESWKKGREKQRSREADTNQTTIWLHGYMSSMRESKNFKKKRRKVEGRSQTETGPNFLPTIVLQYPCQWLAFIMHDRCSRSNWILSQGRSRREGEKQKEICVFVSSSSSQEFLRK